MKKNYFNETNLMRGILACPFESYELARALGAAIDAFSVYTSVCTRPDKLFAMNSKRGVAVSKGRKCIGIISTMQRTVGCRILTTYIAEEEDILEFIQDLDDFMNVLYVQKRDDDEETEQQKRAAKAMAC